jgi:hypothetical protein
MEARLKKAMKKSENGEVEAAICYQWFIQRSSSGQHVSGLVLCEKALILISSWGVVVIRKESPPQNKNFCWIFLVPLV